MSDKIMDDASIALVKAANLPISLAAIEEIIVEEDSSQHYYEQHYRHPEWPGGASGVTVMLGYDLGYCDRPTLHGDLDGKLPPAMIDTMCTVLGIHGPAAHDAMLRIRSSIDIPWSVALDVFLHRDMPKWIATCEKYLPNFDLLSPDSKGALVSLAYNRGPSFNNDGDRYREMRAIKADMVAKNFADIPAQFRAMARLWTGGVHDRRFREAALFQRGLVAAVASSPAPAPSVSDAAVRGTVKAAGLNVRTDASAASAIVETLAHGAAMEIIGEKANGDTLWLQVNVASGKSGWVVASYVDTAVA